MASWAKFNGEERDAVDVDVGGRKDEFTKNSVKAQTLQNKQNSQSQSCQEDASASGESVVGRGCRVKVSARDQSARADLQPSGTISEVANSRTASSNYENGFVLVDDDDDNDEVSQLEKPEEEKKILDSGARASVGKEDSGGKIRREARHELMRESSQQATSKRSDSRPDSIGESKVSTSGNSLDTEKSTKKLVNGKSPRDTSSSKHVHHVQFNKDLRQRQPQSSGSQDKPHPSPSISTSSSSSSEDNSSLGQFSEARPPDGGWGWVVVAASFMVNLIADGITFSFGVIYVEFLNYFGEGKAKTAWIGSLFMAMPLLSGPIASFLTDRYGCRRVSIAGSILATAGFVISSFASSMELLIFTFGVVAGFGLSLCFVAAVVIVAYYFDKKRSFATGLSVCGSGIGTFIFAPVTQYLLAEYGWRGTTLILAGLFFNLAVCGCLMRDLEWTTIRAKAKNAERRANRERKRTRIQSTSADSFSASSSANTNTQTPHGDPKRNFASANAMIIESLRLQEEEDGGKLFSSLVSLPTFVKNGEKVPLEVLELLSTRKNVYNVLLQNYPSLLMSSVSFSDSGPLNEAVATEQSVARTPVSSPVEDKQTGGDEAGRGQDGNDEKQLQPRQPNQEIGDKNWQHQDAAYLWWLKKINPDSPLRRSATLEPHRRLPTAYLKDIRVHRHSLTYRGAMLNINRYRLRASSCPDIYRNSMTTIAKTKLVSYAGLWEFWDLVVDMLDFSHFADSRFLLFSISNFLLHTWYDVPYVYLTDNAIEMGFSETDASILISVIGIMNMTGEASSLLNRIL